MPELLNDILLQGLERRWATAGANTSEGMEPGLDDAAMDEIAQPLGWGVPDEVRRLFRWHNGSSLRTFVARRSLLPFEVSVRQTLELRADDDDWKPFWLKVFDEQPYVALDCSRPRDAPVAVWHYDYASDVPTKPVFASIGDMFTFWIELIDDGVMYWERPYWKLRNPLPDAVATKLAGVPRE